MLARLALNIQFRIVYPFLPAISRGLSVPLETASLLLTARAVTAAASPFLGMLADRFGRRSLMLGGLAVLAGGSLLVALAPSFGPALAAFALLGLAKTAYDPSMQAYVSDAVPYARRGRVIGLLELSWSLAWLLGVPAAGLLIGKAGWQAPYLAIAGLGALSLAALARRKLEGARADLPVHRKPILPGSPIRLLPFSAFVALGVNLLMVLAIENVSIVYGAWMEGQFGLSVAALGVASTVIALAEFTAECGAAGLVDRVGKRRAVLAGQILSVLAYLLLPHLAGGLVGALAGTGLLFLAFEFGTCSFIPLLTELAPGAQATVMALNVAATALARVIASFSSPRLWEAGGLPLTTLASAAVAALAVMALIGGVHEIAPVPSTQAAGRVD